MNVIYYSINNMLEPEYNKILKKLIKRKVNNFYKLFWTSN